jgi:extradiol dioxygenase family protein
MDNIIFHLAIPITDIDSAKKFYRDILGAKVGRENKQAVIFNFYGHQLVGHITKEELVVPKSIYPRHFGLIFIDESDWDNLLSRCREHNLSFYQPARLRFPAEITEHKTFFLQDPFYNILEFKFYRHYEAIFGANQFSEIGDR